MDRKKGKPGKLVTGHATDEADASVPALNSPAQTPSPGSAKAPAKISVQLIDGPGCRVNLSFGFDPKTLGDERSDQIWFGVAQIVQALLEPDEIPDFMEQFERAVNYPYFWKVVAE